ncbi:hypothetical protein GGX14DRAFT_413193 [Mycena pura]|uniref:Autophagy-related protein 27 n=1 Tax=Mycena pura TaxID=153505 RepID=A0AAD7E4I9_9AGAR|nr:hypothetical protein GGX14DRAFT_413193 [Mycena pura]
MRVRACGPSFLLVLRLKNALAANHACNFTLDGLGFNLCPLFSTPGKELLVSFAEETPPTRTTQRYAIRFGAPLKHDGTLRSELQCPDGTWICLTVLNTRPSNPSEPDRILQVVPVANDAGLNPRAKMLTKVRAEDLHEPMQVTLHGGLYNRQPQKASFQFHCDHTLEEPTSPEFIWKFNGTHTFSWRTKHACPRALPPGAPGPQPEEPDPDPPATPPIDPDADAEDGDSTSPPSKSLLLVLFWTLVSGLLLRALYPSLLRSRLGRRLSLELSIARKKGFRPAPLSLANWAAEEHPEEYDIDGTNRSMHTLSEGEQSPLTPSKTTFATNHYGSAG